MARSSTFGIVACVILTATGCGRHGGHVGLPGDGLPADSGPSEAAASCDLLGCDGGVAAPVDASRTDTGLSAGGDAGLPDPGMPDLGRPDLGPPDPCNAAGPTCGTCVVALGCAFCADDGGSCRTRETATCARWMDCRSVCEVQPDCPSCDATAGCGFCGDGATCMIGDASGPRDDSCADWRPTPDSC